MKHGVLGYNRENDRYGLLRSDLWINEGFHCGETLEVKIDGEWFFTRIEYDGEWYLVGTPFRGDSMAYLTARIE